MSNNRIVKKRLRIPAQKGGKEVDRLISFAIGDVDERVRKTLRGVVLSATDLWDVKRQMGELTEMATVAAEEGRVQAFLLDLERAAHTAGTSEAQTMAEPVPTFEIYVEEWKTLALHSLTESEQESARSILKLHLVPFFGHLRLTAITMRLVDQYKAKKRTQEHQFGTGYSAKAVNNHLSVLRRVLVTALEHELIDRLPLSQRMWVRESAVEEGENWLAPDEEARLVSFLVAQPDGVGGRNLALLVQLVAGLRFSEVRALEKVDLDGASGGVHIRRSQARKKTGTPKNKRPRFQPLPEVIVERLKAYALTTEGPRLFVGDGGGPLSNNVLNRALRAACQGAGVREVTSHGLRRTAGTRYAYEGASQLYVAKMLGHADLKSTARYTKVHDPHCRALLEQRWRAVTAGGQTAPDQGAPH